MITIYLFILSKKKSNYCFPIRYITNILNVPTTKHVTYIKVWNLKKPYTINYRILKY